MGIAQGFVYVHGHRVCAWASSRALCLCVGIGRALCMCAPVSSRHWASHLLLGFVYVNALPTTRLSKRAPVSSGH